MECSKTFFFYYSLIVAPECSLVETMYTVAEGEGAFVDIVVRTTNVVGVGQVCVLTTEADSAVAGKGTRFCNES